MENALGTKEMICKNGYVDSIVEDFYDLFIETITKTGSELEDAFQDEGVSNNAVCYLKILCAASLRLVFSSSNL
jgi:hypothetical protein